MDVGQLIFGPNSQGTAHNTLVVNDDGSLTIGGSISVAGTDTEAVILASAARTANAPTMIQTNTSSSRGVLLTLNVTAIGTGGLQVRLWAVDPATGLTIALDGGAPALIIAAGRYGYMYYPGIAEVAKTGSGFIQQSKSVCVPKTWSPQVAHGDATSWTYSLSYQLLP